MNEILSRLNHKSDNNYRLLRPNQYTVKKILVDNPLKVQDLLRDPRVINKKSTNTPKNSSLKSNILSQIDRNLNEKSFSSKKANLNLNNNNTSPIQLNTKAYNINNKQNLNGNLTIINQNRKYRENNEILILNTPYIEKNIYEKRHIDSQIEIHPHVKNNQKNQKINHPLNLNNSNIKSQINQVNNFKRVINKNNINSNYQDDSETNFFETEKNENNSIFNKMRVISNKNDSNTIDVSMQKSKSLINNRYANMSNYSTKFIDLSRISNKNDFTNNHRFLNTNESDIREELNNFDRKLLKTKNFGLDSKEKNNISNCSTYNNSANQIKNNLFSTINIHEDNEDILTPVNSKLYLASQNINNLEIFSKINNYKKINPESIQKTLKKVKSKSELNGQEIIFHNKKNFLSNISDYNNKNRNQTFNTFTTIDQFTSTENEEKNYKNSNFGFKKDNGETKSEDIRFKLIKKKLDEIGIDKPNDVHEYGKTINNTKIIETEKNPNWRNLRNNQSIRINYSSTINTDNHFRSYSEIRLKNESQALQDLTRILKNKSVEKLSNMNLEKLEIKTTKDGIEIIDTLINNLTRLKTIMIEEDEKNKREVYDTINNVHENEKNISKDEKLIKNDVNQFQFYKEENFNLHNISQKINQVSQNLLKKDDLEENRYLNKDSQKINKFENFTKSDNTISFKNDFVQRYKAKIIEGRSMHKEINQNKNLKTNYESEKFQDENSENITLSENNYDNKTNYDIMTLNKSIEANNFFKSEDLINPFTKSFDIYPRITKSPNNKITFGTSFPNVSDDNNDLDIKEKIFKNNTNAYIKDIIDPDRIINEKKNLSIYEKLHNKKKFNTYTENSLNKSRGEDLHFRHLSSISNNGSIFNKTCYKTPINKIGQQKILFTPNKKFPDNNPIKVKRYENDCYNNIKMNQQISMSNKNINNPNLISFNNLSENIFFIDEENKEFNKKENVDKDLINYEFDDRFVD